MRETIPEDLKRDYDRARDASTRSVTMMASCDWVCGLIERIAKAEARNKVLEEALRDVKGVLGGSEIMIGFLLEYAERCKGFEKVSKRNANITRCKILDTLEKIDAALREDR